MRVHIRWGAGALNRTHDTDSHRGAESTVRQHIHSVVLLPRDKHMMSSDKDGSNSNIFLTLAFCKRHLHRQKVQSVQHAGGEVGGGEVTEKSLYLQVQWDFQTNLSQREQRCERVACN